MKRLATFEWRSPPATAIDKCLAIYDDGSARLVVTRPRAPTGAIGSFVITLGPDDLNSLTSAGEGPFVFETHSWPEDSAVASLMAIANRVSSAALAKPRALATFYAGPLAAIAEGSLAMALIVVGSGTKAVEFELEPSKCTVHFSEGAQPVTWIPMPELGSGFVTPDAEGLGGLRRRAKVKPRAYGATAFDISAPGNATAVSIEVVGWLAEALPDERTPRLFAVRTEEAAIPSSP